MMRLAANLWSHWSLLEALGSPALLAARVRQAGYEAALLADHQSLVGLMEWETACRTAGLLPLFGVSGTVLLEQRAIPVTLVGSGEQAWPVMTRMAGTTGPVPWQEAAEPCVYWLLGDAPQGWTSGEVEALRQRVAGLLYATHDPRAGPIAGVAPLAAPAVRYPHRDDEAAYRILCRIGDHEPSPAAGPVPEAESLAAQWGAHHPAIMAWQRLVEWAENPIPPTTRRLPEWPGTSDGAVGPALRQLAEAGLAERLGGTVPAAYRERLERELGVIEALELSAYFLLVQDLVAWARRQQIVVGPGRGSAAASLTAWAVHITDVDPVRFGLVFERFLNPARKTLPDIDLDIEDTRRGELLPYLQARYGMERVAQIGAFGTLAARAALRDTARVMDVPATLMDRVLALVPRLPGTTLGSAYDESRELAQLVRDPGVAPWWDIAVRLEGTPRHESTHAAGVVIGPDTLDRWVPLRRERDAVVTRLPMQAVERLGLLKLDLLGLRTLSVIARTTALADPPCPAWTQVPEDDPEAAALLTSGETDEVFQLDGRGVKDLLRRLAPTGLRDVMLAVALFRPGPMEQVRVFLERRRGAPLPHDAWSGLLRETHGVLVYQEQLMAVTRELAGFSWEEADLFRRAISKKDRELLETQAEEFCRRLTDRGLSREAAEGLWERIAAFADYGFNQAHAAAYGLIAYYQAYQKAHWPLAFWAASLSTLDQSGRLGNAVRAAVQEGIDVAPPDVNRSGRLPIVEGSAVRLGLLAIRGVGESAVDSLLAARSAGGLFRSGEDCWQRLGRRLPPGVWEQLERAGAFGTLEPTRGEAPGQMSFFDEPEERGRAWHVDPVVGLGFPWPQPDGTVYVQVERVERATLSLLEQAAAAAPGPASLIVVEARTRRGHRTPVTMADDVTALRRLRRTPGVTGVVRGVRP